MVDSYQEVRRIDEKKHRRRVQEKASLLIYSEFKCSAGWNVEENSSIAAEQNQRKTNN